jgi:hypothetical protein
VSEGGPDWVREGLGQAYDELRAFVRTAVDFTLRPTEFAREWATGQRHALNPLGFLATAFGAFGVNLAVLGVLEADKPDSPSLLGQALGAILPFCYYLAIGIVQHGVLRLFGSRRPLRDTCAMALYAGGPAIGGVIVAHWMVYAIYRATGTTHVGSSLPLVLFAMLVVGIFWTSLSAALAALHRPNGIRSWHILIANLGAMVVTGLLFALLHPPGAYGLHLILGPSKSQGQWHMRFGFSG